MKRTLCSPLLVLAICSIAQIAMAEPGRRNDMVCTPDVVYGHKHGMALTFDVFAPKENGNGAGILFIVSGGWQSQWMPTAHMEGWVAPLVDAGFTAFTVRHGSSPKFNIPEVVEDVRRSVRFIRQNAERFGVDPERLGVTGSSAGGHLSLMLGTTADKGNPDASDKVLRVSDRVAAVVAYFPPTDIRPWVVEGNRYHTDFPALRFDPAKAADYSPLLHVSEDDPPMLLIHGDKDKLVPLDHSERFHAALTKKGVSCKLIVIEGAAHGFPGAKGKQAVDAMAAWFTKHLAAE